MTSKLGLPPEDVAERIEDLPARLAELRGLAAVWLFGSWARGEATPVSDVDLAYLPAADGDGVDAGLYRVVTKVLGTDEVTLADVRALPATVAWQVVAEGRLLVLRDPD
ncbi:MAG: nucleotidyltransferase domain-containing protein, partial [Armatimonadota bacterium]|nr:nucleotidyltransferase domain-containing protein [Armatimonadota bacterium]